ncbi:MAG: hypothetical protein IJH14_06480 [Solobacterium sp.]|nr:hypothetical protein [Solobacterium sp.]
MTNAYTGVFPVHKNQFKVGATAESLNTVADLETFGVAFDNGIEEWHPFESEGWVRRLMTAKSVTITFSGKRNIGDTGNDWVAGLALKNGAEATGVLEWTMVSGAKLILNGVFNVTNDGGGDSTNVGGLEFEVQSDGKPTFTPAA